MQVKIYHNPRCSKSRQTLQILRDHDYEPEIIEYLNTPPSANELKEVLTALELSPRDLMRKKEQEYKDNNLADDSLTDDELIDAMVKFPRIIERPIVITSEGKYALGRPPEKVLDII